MSTTSAPNMSLQLLRMFENETSHIFEVKKNRNTLVSGDKSSEPPPPKTHFWNPENGDLAHKIDFSEPAKWRLSKVENVIFGRFLDDFRDPDLRYSDPQNATLNRIYQSGRAEIWHDFGVPKISNLGPKNRPKITFSTFDRRHLAGSEKSILPW